MPRTEFISSLRDVTDLVGVIDIKGGFAVHAIAGKRDQYQAVSFCSGSPKHLLEHYAGLGIRRFYVADLDAIEHQAPNAEVVDVLAKISGDQGKGTEIIFDLGWRGSDLTPFSKFMGRLAKRFGHCHWIVATETVPSPSALSELVDRVGPARILLSLDYRRGRLLGPVRDESDWLRAATRLGINRFVVLDLDAVGSEAGPTTGKTCQNIVSAIANPQIYSGGGIRHQADIDALRASGCSHYLLATALYPNR
jgi:phosphoribosylformimino-5-aminoimidazole carboxamide ribotide isomerase